MHALYLILGSYRSSVPSFFEPIFFSFIHRRFTFCISISPSSFNFSTFSSGPLGAGGAGKSQNDLISPWNWRWKHLHSLELNEPCKILRLKSDEVRGAQKRHNNARCAIALWKRCSLASWKRWRIYHTLSPLNWTHPLKTKIVLYNMHINKITV